MNDNEINFTKDHDDTSGHGFKLPAPAAVEDTDDTEAHSVRGHGGVSPADESDDDAEGHNIRIHPSPSIDDTEDTEDTEGHAARVHP